MSNFVIFHFVSDLRPSAGGIAAVVPALARGLRQLGIESRFVTSAHDPDFEWADFTTRLPSSELPIRDGIFRYMRKALHDLPTDTKVVFHSHGIWKWLNHVGLRLAEREGLPSLISAHGMLLPWARSHKKIRKDVAWTLYQRRDCLRSSGMHVTSAREAEIVSNIVSPKHLHIIPFGVAMPEVVPPFPETNDSRTLLFLGRLHEVKNIEGLIRAFVRAAPEDYRLRIIGPDEHNRSGRLSAVIASLGAVGRVFLPGAAYGHEKEIEIGNAHAIVLPSFSENFGSVIAEALAMGRPVIATTGTPWEVLSSERCGWWVPPTEAGLGEAIQSFSDTNDADLAAMGRRGRAYVARELGWAKVSDRMAALYSALG